MATHRRLPPLSFHSWHIALLTGRNQILCRVCVDAQGRVMSALGLSIVLTVGGRGIAMGFCAHQVSPPKTLMADIM